MQAVFTVCAPVCVKYPKMLKECFWSSEAGVTYGCVLSHISAGNQIKDLCKNNKQH